MLIPLSGSLSFRNIFVRLFICCCKIYKKIYTQFEGEENVNAFVFFLCTELNSCREGHRKNAIDFYHSMKFD